MRNAKIKIIKPVPNKNHCAYRHFWAHFSNMVMKGNYFEVSTYVQKKNKKKNNKNKKNFLKLANSLLLLSSVASSVSCAKTSVRNFSSSCGTFKAGLKHQNNKETGLKNKQKI